MWSSDPSSVFNLPSPAVLLAPTITLLPQPTEKLTDNFRHEFHSILYQGGKKMPSTLARKKKHSTTWLPCCADGCENADQPNTFTKTQHTIKQKPHPTCRINYVLTVARKWLIAGILIDNALCFCFYRTKVRSSLHLTCVPSSQDVSASKAFCFA